MSYEILSSLNFGLVTDTKQRIGAHHAICTGGLKNNINGMWVRSLHWIIKPGLLKELDLEQSIHWLGSTKH